MHDPQREVLPYPADEPGADVCPVEDQLPATKTPEVSFDHDLDPDLPVSGETVHVDQAPAHTRRPIVPEHLRTRAGITKAAQDLTGRTGYRLGYHALRSPRYLLFGAFWALVGVFRLVGRQLRWAWHPQLSSLLQHAATTNDMHEGRALHDDLSKVRKARGMVLLVELVVLVVSPLVAWFTVPHRTLVLVVVLLAVVPVLARVGRPVDRPILSAAVVTAKHRRINADVVLRAYYVAKLGDPDKPGQQIEFGSQMARDRLNRGSQVLVKLPYGRTFTETMNARPKLASGLDVAVSQVSLTPDRTSNRQHLLWVADVDPLSIPAGRSPLLDCRPRDIWRAMPLGVDERGNRVMLPLIFTSLLVGAQPRKGKTFTARAVGLFAALDPYVRISVFDGKGSPDWRKFALVAFTCGFGLLPDRVQGNPIENLLSTLRAAKKDVLERNGRLSELPTSVCPEGKLTREIARDPRYGMPVWLIILDEFQEYLSTGDTELDEEVADLLVFLVKVGPSVGVILLSSTQKPSGLGSTGKVAKRFTDYRDQHQTRFALKTGSYQVSDAVLGSGAYGEGWDASSLPVGDGSDGGYDYRGIGILHDAPVPSATVRTYLADGGDAERILLAARKLRERLGVLEGMAAGANVVVQPRDPLGDTLTAFRGAETFLTWESLAERLAEQLPERYGSESKESLSSLLRDEGIESKTGSEPGRRKGLRGAYRADLARAAQERSARRSAP